MRNTKFKFLTLVGALVPGIATSVVAQDTIYVWQSADGDPFNIQGTIVLDSPSSANGSASDVVSLYHLQIRWILIHGLQRLVQVYTQVLLS